MSKEKYLSIFLKSNGSYCVYYSSNIFRNMREYSHQDLPICHMSIASKFVSWLPKSPLLHVRFRFSRKRLFEEKINI